MTLYLRLYKVELMHSKAVLYLEDKKGDYRGSLEVPSLTYNVGDTLKISLDKVTESSTIPTTQRQRVPQVHSKEDKQ